MIKEETDTPSMEGSADKRMSFRRLYRSRSPTVQMESIKAKAFEMSPTATIELLCSPLKAR